MPQIIFKCVSREQMQQLARPLIEQLAQEVDCPEDWLSIELCPSEFFGKEGPDPHYPVVQVWWFQRPKEVQDRVAGCISRLLLQAGYPTVQVSFHLFGREDYYEFE